MKPHSLVNLRTVVAALCGVWLATGVAVHRAQADEWDKKTILTVNQPIQVRDKLLQPGTYVFKLLDSPSDRHIVQIFNSDQSHIIDTVLAIPNYRLQPTGNSQFAFWETPPGNARALRAWFYPGDNFGQEFPYPKHFIQLEAAVTTAPAPVPVAVAPPQAETPATQPAAPVTETPQPETQPAQVAEAAPPPEPAPEPAPLPPPEQPAPPQTLPKTGSLYPLIGLSGLFSLALYGLFRLKRSS